MRDPRRPVERAERAVEPALPAVRARECACGGGVGRGELRQRAQTLPLRRRVVERPRQRRERAAPRPAPHVLRVEHRLHLVPERARLARAAVVGRRLADEIEPVQRPGARRVEEVAVAADRVRPLQAGAALVERAAGVVVEERRRRAAPRQAPLLESEDEDDVEAACPGAHQVDDGDATRLVSAHRPQRLPLERRHHVVARQFADEPTPALQLTEQPCHRLVRAQVEPRRLRRRRTVESIGTAEHPGCQRPHRLDRIVGALQLRQRGQRRAAQLLRLLDDALRRLDCASTQPSLDEVDGAPLQSGEGRAEVGEEIAPRAAEPREAQHRGKRMTERRLREPHLAVDRVRDTEGGERGLQRRAAALDARADDPDRLRRNPRAQQREQLLADQLERAAGARAFEEADGAVQRHGRRRLVAEQRALEMRDRRVRSLAGARRQLLDASVGETGEIVGGATERCERGSPRLVR